MILKEELFIFSIVARLFKKVFGTVAWRINIVIIIIIIIIPG
jgi:hypothetical protein